jgi:hypothetical protein
MTERVTSVGQHDVAREEEGYNVRAVCSCTWAGPWRHRRAYLVEKTLHSDENGHLHAVRRAKVGES